MTDTRARDALLAELEAGLDRIRKDFPGREHDLLLVAVLDLIRKAGRPTHIHPGEYNANCALCVGHYVEAEPKP